MLFWFGYISNGEMIASPLHETILGDESITRVLVVRSSRTELFVKNLCFMNHDVLDGNRPNFGVNFRDWLGYQQRVEALQSFTPHPSCKQNALARKGCLNRLTHSWQKGTPS